MDHTRVIAGIHDWSVMKEDDPHTSDHQREQNYLKPYRLVVPGFLPKNIEVAKSIVTDLVGDHRSCEGVWIVDNADSWPNKEMLALVEHIDWDAAEVLEYNWDEKDHWGENAYDPWSMWCDLGDKRKRAKALEPFIVEERGKSERYAKLLGKDQWEGFMPDDLVQNPCWMFYYAKNVCRGRLPDVLDNAMTMLSFQDADNPWIKRYFGTKRYRVRNRKALASIAWAA